MLSDPQRRERYDMGEDEDGMNGGGAGGFPGGMNMNPSDIEEIFAQFAGGRFAGGGAGGGARRGHTHSFPF